MKEAERKFNADKALMERKTYNIQLKTANTLFEKGHEAMMEFMSQAIERYDARKGVFMPN